MILNSRLTQNLANKSLIIFMSILLILGTSLAAKPQAANATTGGSTTTTFSIINESYYGDQVTLDATVSVNGQNISNLAGTVTFYDGDIVLESMKLDHNRAGFTFNDFSYYPSLGEHNFKAVYSGSGGTPNSRKHVRY